MPSIEMSNGQIHQINEPSTVGGAIRRIESAKAEGKLARFKDNEDDTIGVEPSSVSSVY